jgi:hypothetical protein
MPLIKSSRFGLVLAAAILAVLGVAAGPAHEPAPGDNVFEAPQSEAESKGVNLGPNVNSEYSDFGPVISPCGNFLYFTSDRPGGQGGQDFWVSERVNGVWQSAKNLGPPVNTPGDEGPDVFSAAEDALYFTACHRQDSLGGCDIYLTRKTKTGWSDPVNLGRPINSEADEVNASIDATGSILVFASNRQGGLGDYDLYLSHRLKNPLGFVPLMPSRFPWGQPKNLGPAVNTPGWEGVGFLAPDGKALYFSSTGRGGSGKADIFKSTFDGAKWSEAVNMGDVINTPRDDIYFTLPGSGELAYFSSDMRGGFGREDIYSISLPVLMPKRVVYVIRGVVKNSQTGAGVAAKLSLTDPQTQKDLVYTESDPGTGSYRLIVCSREAELQVKAKKFRPYSEHLALDTANSILILKDIALEPLE